MFHSSEYLGPNTQFQENGKATFADNMDRASSGYRVLVVHHHPDTLHMMATMFRKLGYQVAATFDSTKALLYFRRRPCDLLFTDLDMPVLNGYHLARLIKKHRPQAKAVAMTFRCQVEVVDLMGDGIIDGWLFKPFKTNEFKDTLAEMGLPVAHHTC
ncbi:MAG: response regulator [Desulfobacteraceae bacterium]|jgi:CheY-like chemotaxis protein